MLELLDKQTYDAFVEKHPYGHYRKMSYWAKYLEPQKYQAVYLGLKENGELQGTAMVLRKNILFGHYDYVLWGPCIDYTNQTNARRFLEELIAFSKGHKAVFLRIDPNVIRVSRNIDGSQKEGLDQEYITDYLKELGFAHRGYGYGYDGSWTNRFTLMQDLSIPMPQIISQFAKSKQNVLKRHDQIGVSSKEGSRDDLDYLVDFGIQLSKIQKFEPHDRKYFEYLLDCLKEHGHLYITEIEVPVMIAHIEEEIESGKYKKDPEALKAKERDLALAKNWQKLGDRLVIAAGIFIVNGDKSWNLFTYNHKDFNSLKPTDNLHRYAMSKMKELGVKDYDFVGFSGRTDKDDRYYGLYEYKKSFGSEFIEYIGEFTMVFGKSRYQLFLFGEKLKKAIGWRWRKLKRRLRGER